MTREYEDVNSSDFTLSLAADLVKVAKDTEFEDGSGRSACHHNLTGLPG